MPPMPPLPHSITAGHPTPPALLRTVIIPVKARNPNAGRIVAVYKNLQRDAWSVRAVDGPHKGMVVAHATTVLLTAARMHVNTRAQARIAAGAAREVHAWITGTLTVEATVPALARITYRPHVRPEFFLASTGQGIDQASLVVFTEEAAYIPADAFLGGETRVRSR